MSDAPAPNLKIKALELANGHNNNESHSQVVDRANAYHAFLTGTAPAAKPTAAAAKPATGAQGATTTAPKPQTAPAQKPAAGAQKPAASSAKPAAKPAGANPPATPSGTSAEGLVMEDVTKALQKVLNAGINPKADADTKAKQKEAGKKRAYKILADVAGADSARNVKPEKYAAVIAACEAAVKAPAAKPAAAPAPAEDDFGATADDGADGAAAGGGADTEVDSDPPEQTGAGEDA